MYIKYVLGLLSPFSNGFDKIAKYLFYVFCQKLSANPIETKYDKEMCLLETPVNKLERKNIMQW